MANPDLGTKQVCPNCQAKFYDLNRRPATCPKCATEFDPEEAVRSRRVRARTTAPDYEADEAPAKPKEADAEDEGFEEADDTPEIDEAIEAEPVEADEAEDGVPAAAPEPDLGVDFEEEGSELEAETEDVPFLEEEDEDAFPDEDLEHPGKDEDR